MQDSYLTYSTSLLKLCFSSPVKKVRLTYHLISQSNLIFSLGLAEENVFFFGAIIINVICTIHQSPTLYYVLNGKELDRDWAITKLLRIVLINLSIKTRKSVKLKVHG